ALVGRQGENVLAVEQHLALGDDVIGLAGEHMREGRLARTVGAHDGVDAAPADRKLEPVEDLLAVDLDVQVFYFPQMHSNDFLARPGTPLKAACRRVTEFAVHPRPSRRPLRGLLRMGLYRQPTLPSKLIEISFCASTANSMGSCCSTSLTKPLTTSATASSAERPRCRQ